MKKDGAEERRKHEPWVQTEVRSQFYRGVWDLGQATNPLS